MANTRAISAIVVPLKTDVSGFSKGIKDATSSGRKFQKETSDHLKSLPFGEAVKGAMGLDKSFGEVTKGVAGMGVKGVKSLALLSGELGALSLAAGAVKAALNVANGLGRLQELGKDAVEIGATADELSRLHNVATASATDFKDLSSFVATLTEKINDSIGKIDLQANGFARLGTSAEALSKLPVGEQLKVLNRGFNALPNNAEKARVAMMLAGEMGVKNFRLLTMSVEDFNKEYDKGLVTTDQDVSEMQKLQAALDKVVVAVEKVAEVFMVSLAPKIAQVADLISGLAQKFGVVLNPPAMPAPVVPKPPPQPKGEDPAKKLEAQAKAQQDLTARKLAAAGAQAKVNKLQELADKQADEMRKTKVQTMPTNNGHGIRLSNRNQKQLNKHNATMQQLNEAKRAAARLRDEALSPAEAIAQAVRMKRVADEVASLRSEYRETIDTAGQDDIHRRVAQIKGTTPEQRKALLQQGYQAREADRTSSLRDELQESTKLPAQKLAEDLNRINRLVNLGAANGGLSQAQGIQAAAMKTRESGLVGGEPRYAGALDARSAEGRSYLLSQMGGRTEDPTMIARQGLAATGQTNNLLGRILQRVGGEDVVMYR